MWDGSAVPLDENLEIAKDLLEQSHEGQQRILEIEIGVVGGEEDGVVGESVNEKLYTTPEDGLTDRSRRSALARSGRYLDRPHLR